jgi:hypothetical protein
MIECLAGLLDEQFYFGIMIFSDFSSAVSEIVNSLGSRLMIRNSGMNLILQSSNDSLGLEPAAP